MFQKLNIENVSANVETVTASFLCPPALTAALNGERSFDLEVEVIILWTKNKR